MHGAARATVQQPRPAEPRAAQAGLFAPPEFQGEIRPLTGIRGVAAFLVMLYHYATSGAFPGVHAAGLRKGYLCVDLFFVLSGFVLAMRYGERFKRNFAAQDYRAFLQSRVARLYPAYLTISILYYAKWVFNMSGTHTPYRLQDFLANILLIQSWALPVRSIISDSWSVSVECLAYVVFPLLVLAGLGRRRGTAAVLALAACGGIIVVAGSGYGVSGPLDAYRGDNASILPVLRCLAGFSLGLLAFRAVLMPWSRRFLAAPWSLGVILVLLAVAIRADRTDLVCVALLPPLVACLFFDGKLSRALFGNRICHHLGEISFSLYLLHPLFLEVAARFSSIASARLGIALPPLFIAAGILSTWIAAYVSYRLLELPGRRLLRQLGGRRTVSAVS